MGGMGRIGGGGGGGRMGGMGRSGRSCPAPCVLPAFPALPAPPACPALLLRARLRLVGEEAGDLLDGVVDLDVERLLAERRGRAARVAGDAVVLARRRVRIGRAAA